MTSHEKRDENLISILNHIDNPSVLLERKVRYVG